MTDINCDLGEGESPAKTRSLMHYVTSANIACGGHAGEIDAMRNCLRLCKEFDVRAGVHPGLYDRANFGRKELPLTEAAFGTLLAQQAGALALMAGRKGVKLTHIKLHGALYHMAEGSLSLARAYVGFVKENLPGVEIYGAPSGFVAKQARKNRVMFRGEVFADRAYTRGGKLVPRTTAGAVLDDPETIKTRMKDWIKTGTISSIDGVAVEVPASTICVHSDSPHALRIAKALRKLRS